jgi:hypothetical protein
MNVNDLFITYLCGKMFLYLGVAFAFLAALFSVTRRNDLVG